MSLFIAICLSFINSGYAIPQIILGSDGMMVLTNTLSMPPAADFGIEYDLKLRPGHSRLFIGAMCHEVTATTFKKTSGPDCSGKVTARGGLPLKQMNDQLKAAYRKRIEIGTSEKKGSVWSDRQNIAKKKSRKKKKKAKKKKSKKKSKKKKKKLPDAVHVPPPHIPPPHLRGFLTKLSSGVWSQELILDYVDALLQFYKTFDGGLWSKTFDFLSAIFAIRATYDQTDDIELIQREMTRVYEENHKDIEHFLDPTTREQWTKWKTFDWIHPTTKTLPDPSSYKSPWYKINDQVEEEFCTKTEDSFKKSGEYAAFLGKHPTWGDIYSSEKKPDLTVKLEVIKSRVGFFLESWDKSKRERLDSPILEAYKISFASFAKTESGEENFNFFLEVQQLFRDFEAVFSLPDSEEYHGDPMVLQRAMKRLFDTYGEDGSRNMINIDYNLRARWRVASTTVNWQILRDVCHGVKRLIKDTASRFQKSAEYHNFLREYPEWTDIEWGDISGYGSSASSGSAVSAHKLKSNVYVPYSENIGDMNDMNEMISVLPGYESSALRYVVYEGILMIVAVAFCVIGTVFGVLVTCFVYENIKIDEKQVNVYGDRI